MSDNPKATPNEDQRFEQARDAYWKAHSGQVRTAMQVDTLRFGVEWADANPQPHTITREQRLDVLAEVFHAVCEAQSEDEATDGILQGLGIEVVGL